MLVDGNKVKQQKMNEEFILVSDITDIELNQSQTVQLGDENILICHTETAFRIPSASLPKEMTALGSSV
jgi:hypothetical protein